jgi:hypothetical protein
MDEVYGIFVKYNDDKSRTRIGDREATGTMAEVIAYLAEWHSVITDLGGHNIKIKKIKRPKLDSLVRTDSELFLKNLGLAVDTGRLTWLTGSTNEGRNRNDRDLRRPHRR